jgi:D-lactate dehydrogenase (cytochrome)
VVSTRIRARLPRGEERRPQALTSPDAVEPYLRDAAGTPGGHTPLVLLPRSEAEVAVALRESRAILPVGAQTSLTGGATPFGHVVLSLSRMDEIGHLSGDEIELGAGVALLSLDAHLRGRGLFHPPAPTYHGASVGGTAATNAAGAATFKYGSTRDWVRGLTVVLANGGVLDLERGRCRAHPEGWFEVEAPDGAVSRVPIPTYTMPRVAKRSAGYHAEPEMDLVDLFVGSEGTLGVVTSVRVGLCPERPRLLAWMGFPSEPAAMDAVARLREAARATWAAQDPRGVDVCAIESMDRRCLELLREDGKDREHGVVLPAGTDTALLIQAELPPGTDAGAAMDQLGSLDEGTVPDTSLTRLCRLLGEGAPLDALQVALPGDAHRAAQLLAVREAVPMAVNHRVDLAKRAGHAGVHKTAADMIVPFEALGEMIGIYREAFARRGLDPALWGHASDGNLHANVVPRTEADVEAGEEAILEFGDHAIRLGGCPLSEHGVGRSSVKQALLLKLYGPGGVEEMRRVKAVLDPEWKLAPGVLFPRSPS